MSGKIEGDKFTFEGDGQPFTVGLEVTHPPTANAMKQHMKEEKKRLLKEKGHDCWETVCTAMDEGSYYYYCCICNDILQS